MGSALSSAPTQLLAIEQCLADVDDGRHSFDMNLQSTRFLKVRRFVSLMSLTFVTFSHIGR